MGIPLHLELIKLSCLANYQTCKSGSMSNKNLLSNEYYLLLWVINNYKWNIMLFCKKGNGCIYSVCINISYKGKKWNKKTQSIKYTLAMPCSHHERQLNKFLWEGWNFTSEINSIKSLLNVGPTKTHLWLQVFLWEAEGVSLWMTSFYVDAAVAENKKHLYSQ